MTLLLFQPMNLKQYLSTIRRGELQEALGGELRACPPFFLFVDTCHSGALAGSAQRRFKLRGQADMFICSPKQRDTILLRKPMGTRSVHIGSCSSRWDVKSWRGGADSLQCADLRGAR